MCFYKLIDTIGFVSTVGFDYSVYCAIIFICWGQCLCLYNCSWFVGSVAGINLINI